MVLNKKRGKNGKGNITQHFLAFIFGVGFIIVVEVVIVMVEVFLVGVFLILTMYKTYVMI